MERNMPNDLNLLTQTPDHHHVTKSLLNVVTSFRLAGRDLTSESPAVETIGDLESTVIRGAFDEMSKETVPTINFSYDIYEIRNRIDDARDAL